MGAVDTKFGFVWSDYTQDVIDESLQYIGFDYEKNYSKKAKMAFYNKLSKSKKHYELFQEEYLSHDWDEITDGKMKQAYRYHLKFSLGLGNVAPIFRDNIKQSGAVNK